MTPSPPALTTFARNVGTRYVLVLVNALIGLVVLPYNVRHLGDATYGLWMLAASLTMYFTALELGYGGAVVRFVAQHRARQDARALNETLSTMFYVFCGLGVLCYLLAIGVAVLLPSIFSLTPDQVPVGRVVLLIISMQVALYFPFSVYGGVINGFERYYVNNVVATAFNVATAVVNVLVLWLGYGLVELILATTATRIAPFWVYRRNAYAVFPQLQLSWQLVRLHRLREVTGFSAYLAAIDWSARLTYTTGAFYLGIFMNTAAVGVYAVAERLADALLRMTNQLHIFLFPAVVQRAVAGGPHAHRSLLVKANRFQLAIAVCLCGSVAAVADVLIPAWVGPGFEGAVAVTQILAFVVVLRAWVAMPATILKGTNHHRPLAAVSAAGAMATLLLSIPLVQRHGLVGVALGVAVPAVAISAGVIFPLACHVAGLRVRDGYREIVWPAVWPALLVLALLAGTRQALPLRLAPVLLHLAAGGAVYLAIFFRFGLSREERHWATAALAQIWRHRFEGLAAA